MKKVYGMKPRELYAIPVIMIRMPVRTEFPESDSAVTVTVAMQTEEDDKARTGMVKTNEY